MNRNVQRFALGAVFLASLAGAWWFTSGGRRSESVSKPAEIEAPTRDAVQEWAQVLDSNEPVQETTDGEAGKDRRVAAEALEAPRLVSGVVRDGDGKLVEGAQIAVTDSPYPHGGATGVRASGSTDAQGRFEIHGTVPPPRLTFAWAWKDGFVRSNPKQFVRGAEDLQLVLQATGVVSGRLLLDPGIATDRISLDITAVGDGKKKAYAGLGFASNQHVDDVDRIEAGPFSDPYTVQFDIDAEGRFTVGGFVAPTVAVVARPIDDSARAFEIPNVAVQRAGAAPDPRLDPIDLRGKLQRFAVDVIDDVGAKRDGVRVASRETGRTDGERVLFTKDGRAEFFRWSGPQDLDVSLDGFRTVHLASVVGDQVVQLRKGIQVRITVRGSAVRPTPPDVLAVALMRGTHWHPILDGIGTLQDPVRATFVVASPGPHEVGWYLQRGSIQAYLETGTTQSVDVRDQDGIQEIAVDLPASAERAWSDRVRAFEETKEQDRQTAEALERKKVEFEKVKRDLEEGIRREGAPEPK